MRLIGLRASASGEAPNERVVEPLCGRSCERRRSRPPLAGPKRVLEWNR